MTHGPNRWIRDVRELKALAHPLRVRLYYALSAAEAATATQLAEIVSESPALVSYHLHQLAVHGFVEEAHDLVQDQRERWWRPAGPGFSWSPNDFDSAEGQRAVAATVKRLFQANQLARLREFEDKQLDWGPQWTDASFASDSLLRLTHEQMTQLHEELLGTLHKWVAIGQDADRDAVARREHVMVLLYGFPFRP